MVKARGSMSGPADLEAMLGHRFAQPQLLEQALTHSSVRHEQQTGDQGDGAVEPIKDNERLEFLGDAVVGMVVGEMLYRRYPELDEGDLTRLRAAMVSRKHLGMVGTGLDLGRHLRLGRAEERNGGRKKAVLLANCMEALIGALYLEGGLAAAAAFVERAVAAPYVEDLHEELRENRSIGDYKTALQELQQSRRGAQPEYVVEAESGPDHRKRFVVEVRVNRGDGLAGELRARGEGSTKKKAAQEAARLLYEQIHERKKDHIPVAAEYRPPARLEQVDRIDRLNQVSDAEMLPEPRPDAHPTRLSDRESDAKSDGEAQAASVPMAAPADGDTGPTEAASEPGATSAKPRSKKSARQAALGSGASPAVKSTRKQTGTKPS